MPCLLARGRSSNSICISIIWVTPRRASSAIFSSCQIPPPTASRSITQVMSIFFRIAELFLKAFSEIPTVAFSEIPSPKRGIAIAVEEPTFEITWAAGVSDDRVPSLRSGFQKKLLIALVLRIICCAAIPAAFVTVNLPNYITLSRIAAIPLIIWLLTTGYFTSQQQTLRVVLASSLFILASLTDSLDGYLARRRGQITTMGTLLDPLADKLMITAAYITLVQLVPSIVSVWIAVIIIC